MKNKELITFLKKYDGDVEIKIGWLMRGFDGLIDYYEEALNLTDIITSDHDWKKTIIITTPDE